MTRYHRPEELAAALGLKAQHPDAVCIAGGTDLMVQWHHNGPAPPVIISLRGIAELARITEGEPFRIGATASLTDVAAHPVVAGRYPALGEAIALFASPQIRNVATLGGNLCNASPAADGVPPLLVYGARVEVMSTGGRREIPLDDFFIGPRSHVLDPSEIVTAILLDEPAPKMVAAFSRRGRVAMDLAIASVAVGVEMDGSACVTARVAAGAVAPTPRRLLGCEEVLVGSTIDADVRGRAAAAARDEIAPIDDLRSSAGYRRHLTGVLVDRALQLVSAPS